MVAMTRDDARAYFAGKGLRYTEDESVLIPYPIHRDDIQKLWDLCDEKLRAGGGDMEMRMRPKWKATSNRNGSIKEAYLRVDGPYFSGREAISFNRDGWIGFAGWASDKNVRPFIDAFVEWVGWFVITYGENARPS